MVFGAPCNSTVNEKYSLAGGGSFSVPKARGSIGRITAVALGTGER